jgi:outer membrane protease
MVFQIFFIPLPIIADDEPAITEELIPEPAITEEPLSPERPAITEEPLPPEEPAVTEEPRTNPMENPGKTQFPYTFSVTPIAGLLYGQVEEIVYRASVGEEYLSELLWDLKPLFYFGSALNFSRINPREKWGGFGTLSMKFGIPMKTGIMEDRDWVDQHSAATHYSSSKASVDGAYMLDFISGASLPIRSVVIGNAYLGLSYMHFQWSANDGYYQYPKGNGSFTGLTVVYSQAWLLFFLGLSASVYVIPKTVLTLSFQGTPLLRYEGHDDHYIRLGAADPGQFEDNIEGGIYLEPGGKIAFSPNDRFSLGFNVSWRYIKGNPHGTTNTRQTGSDRDGRFYLMGHSAGAGYQALDLGLTATIRF